MQFDLRHTVTLEEDTIGNAHIVSAGGTEHRNMTTRIVGHNVL